MKSKYEIATVPNQKVVTVQKEECSRKDLYATYNLNALQCAMINLKGESFKLWMYLGKNQDGYSFALSSTDAVKWGIGSVSSYNRAVKELTEKGYLVRSSGNFYDFYELPKAEDIIVTVHKEEKKAVFSF